MMNTDQLNGLVYKACLRLKELTGINYEKLGGGKMPLSRDGLVRLIFNDSTIEYEVEGKSEVRELGNLWVKMLVKYHTEENLRNILMVSRYFSPKVKEELKRKRVSYLEASGNCCIQSNGVFVFIDGQKSEPARINKVNKSFHLPGLKLILTLLSKPNLVNSSYREMSDIAQIALGSVGWILRDLKQQDYIEEERKVKTLINRYQLFERWAELYPLTLKKKQLIGRYKCIDEQLKFSNDEYWLISALNLNEKAPKATDYTIYTTVKKNELKKKFGLVKDDEGGIEVMTPFWNIESDAFGTNNMVNPLLNYVDRVNHPTKRKLSTNEIKDFLNKLKPILNEKD